MATCTYYFHIVWAMFHASLATAISPATIIAPCFVIFIIDECNFWWYAARKARRFNNISYYYAAISPWYRRFSDQEYSDITHKPMLAMVTQKVEDSFLFIGARRRIGRYAIVLPPTDIFFRGFTTISGQEARYLYTSAPPCPEPAASFIGRRHLILLYTSEIRNISQKKYNTTRALDLTLFRYFGHQYHTRQPLILRLRWLAEAPGSPKEFYATQDIWLRGFPDFKGIAASRFMSQTWLPS